MPYPFRNLVFDGDGVKGIAYVGFIKPSSTARTVATSTATIGNEPSTSTPSASKPPTSIFQMTTKTTWLSPEKPTPKNISCGMTTPTIIPSTGPNAHMPSFLASFLCAALSVCSGCSVHYYEKQSGTEHLWGFGHMKMKIEPPNEGVQAVVKGTETLGFNLAAGQEDYHIGFGWDYRRRILISSNAAVRLEWPNGDFFKVRVGTAPPFAINSSRAKNKINR